LLESKQAKCETQENCKDYLKYLQITKNELYLDKSWGWLHSRQNVCFV